MSHTNSADALIEQLGLSAHPEGGWFKETWRADADDTGRAKGTAIVFLLKSGESSHWHRVDADEMWIWQGGDPLDLAIADGDAGPVRTIRLGGDEAPATKTAHAQSSDHDAVPIDGKGFFQVVEQS